MATKAFCDKCEIELHPNPNDRWINRHIFRGEKEDDDGLDYDLCPKHAKEFDKLVKDWLKI